MPEPTGSFIWYELMTSDSDSAARFYAGVVGWKISDRPDPQAGGMDYRHILRSDGGSAGGVLKLTPDMLAHGARPAWVGYLHVADVDAAVRAIAADGGRVLMPRMDLPVGAMAMVTDPMGTPFYVMAPIPPPGKPEARSDVFDPAAAQRVRWNELASPDLARAKAFYARHFGFQFNEVMPMGPMGDYCFIDHGGQRLGAIMQQPQGSGPMAAWQFYFGVTSVTAAKAAIEGGGGKVLNGPHQVPGGDWILTATDPSGAAFGVVGPKGG
ncbi:MAG: VOC family protein [Steroidobacteraceae bacterium]